MSLIEEKTVHIVIQNPQLSQTVYQLPLGIYSNSQDGIRF
jgi:hypothetical protein